MREKYESLSVTILRDLAKARGIKGTSAMKKADLVEAMLAQDEIDKQNSVETEESAPKAVKEEMLHERCHEWSNYFNFNLTIIYSKFDNINFIIDIVR